MEQERPRLSPTEWLTVGLGAGLLGGIALAAPVVVWDWRHTGRLAFELPMAATAWLFGLRHFSNAHYLAWPLVVGIALLAAYVVLSGIAFTGLADRAYRVAHPLTSLAAGFAWGFVSFIFFWDMLLPIARGGAPFRAAARAPGLYVAPTWVWILGFTLLGLTMGACFAALRTPARGEERERPAAPSPLQRAA